MGKSSEINIRKLYSAITIARYFIYKNHCDKKGLTNKKLQKLLYYSQAWHLVLFGNKLFKENIEAWVHGPAVPVIYERYKSFGRNNIDEEVKKDVLERFDGKELNFLENIWSLYGSRDAEYLEVLSHSELPWQEARRDIEPFESSNNIITEEMMKTYYGQKIREKKGAE